MDFKEDLLHPIKKFLNGEQRNIYDAVKTTLDGNTANFTYIQSDELDTLKTLVGSKTPYKGNGVQLAKAALDTIREKVTGLIDAEKSDFLKAADEQLADIKGRADYSELSSEKQRQLVKTIEDLKGVVAKERYISNIRQQTDRLPDLHTDALNKLNRFVAQETTGDKVAEPEVQWIRMSRIHIKFDKKELVTEEELEAYLEALRTEYLKRIKDNTKIVLN